MVIPDSRIPASFKENAMGRSGHSFIDLGSGPNIFLQKNLKIKIKMLTDISHEDSPKELYYQL